VSRATGALGSEVLGLRVERRRRTQLGAPSTRRRSRRHQSVPLGAPDRLGR